MAACASSQHAPPTAALEPAWYSTPVERLSDDDIAKGFKAQARTLARCIEKARERGETPNSYVLRINFVIDGDGIVRHRQVVEDARNEPDYDAVFAALASL